MQHSSIKQVPSAYTKLPQSLLEATQLIKQAKQIIFKYDRDNEQRRDSLYPHIFEIESSLNLASNHIADIVSIEFEEQYFYSK